VPRPASIRAKLDANESPFPLPEDIASKLAGELAAVDLNRYPRADCGELRALVAADLGVAPGSLSFGNGSDELIALLIAAFAEPREGRESASIIYPVPSFVVYRIATVGAGAEAIEVPLDADFEIDEAAFDAAVAANRPNIAFFALPNNPTGTLWSRDYVERLARDNPDMLVVSDEAYIDYGGDTLVGAMGELPNLIIMRTLSKIGMAGLRIGFVSAHPAVISELEKVRPPYNIGSLNQVAATYLLANHADYVRERCAAIVAERDRVYAALDVLDGLQVFPSRANLLLLRVGTPGDGRANELWKQLAERGVLVRNFDKPGLLSGCLRVSIGTVEENTLFLSEIAELLA
jgi:histidinol-phosphate aminotransferase